MAKKKKPRDGDNTPAKTPSKAVADKYIAPQGRKPKSPKPEAEPEAAGPTFSGPEKEARPEAAVEDEIAEVEQRRLAAYGFALAAAKRMGRPTKYKPEFCGMAVALGTIGKSKIEIASVFGVDDDTIRNWEDAHPEFAVAMARSLVASQAWWEDYHRSNLLCGRDLGAPFIFAMKNRFRDPDHGYHDRQQVDVKGDGFAAFVAAVHAGKVPIPPNPHKESDDEKD